MKIQNIYIDEISNRRFDSEAEAIESEKKNGGIKRMFSFWVKHPEDKRCEFANGKWSYQRTESEYNKLIETIIEATNTYEPWIAKQYKEHGGLKPKMVRGWSFLGRYFDDGNSELKEWYSVQICICQKCFREHGQAYYALHCEHNKEIRKLKD